MTKRGRRHKEFKPRFSIDVETDVINKMRSIESCRTSGSFQFFTSDGRSQGELLDFVHGNEG